MNRTILRWTAPAIVGAVIALAGCTGGGSPVDEAESPLTEYFSAVYGGELSPEEQEAQFASDDKQREELVAACMQEQGFDYQPVDNTAYFSSSDGSEYKPDDREWVSQWGYGAVEFPGSDEPAMPEEDMPVDPNSAYVESLSESEQAAYGEALYGPTPSEDEIGEDGSYEYNWETAGCQGAADHEMTGDDPLQSGEFDDVMEAMTALYEDVQTSPEMADLNAEWAACMDEAGQPGFVAQPDAQNSIYDALNEFWEENSEQGPAEADLDALQKTEIEVALADLDCREKTDYRAASQKVQFAAEEQFIEDHKAELDAMKAAAEQARS